MCKIVHIKMSVKSDNPNKKISAVLKNWSHEYLEEMGKEKDIPSKYQQTSCIKKSNKLYEAIEKPKDIRQISNKIQANKRDQQRINLCEITSIIGNETYPR